MKKGKWEVEKIDWSTFHYKGLVEAVKTYIGSELEAKKLILIWKNKKHYKPKVEKLLYFLKKVLLNTALSRLEGEEGKKSMSATTFQIIWREEEEISLEKYWKDTCQIEKLLTDKRIRELREIDKALNLKANLKYLEKYLMKLLGLDDDSFERINAYFDGKFTVKLTPIEKMIVKCILGKLEINL